MKIIEKLKDFFTVWNTGKSLLVGALCLGVLLGIGFVFLPALGLVLTAGATLGTILQARKIKNAGRDKKEKIGLTVFLALLAIAGIIIFIIPLIT